LAGGVFEFVRVRIQWEIPRAEALTLSALLAPASLASFTTGCWQIAAQLRWTTPLVSGGIFSYGQVWLAMAAVLLLAVSLLDYYSRTETTEEHQLTQP
jgi:hypothetical protein